MRIKNELKSNLTLVQLLEDNQIMDGFDWYVSSRYFKENIFVIKFFSILFKLIF